MCFAHVEIDSSFGGAGWNSILRGSRLFDFSLIVRP